MTALLSQFRSSAVIERGETLPLLAHLRRDGRRASEAAYWGSRAGRPGLRSPSGWSAVVRRLADVWERAQTLVITAAQWVDEAADGESAARTAPINSGNV
jgi:hypothetical protein